MLALKYVRTLICQLFVVTALLACDPWFSYSPYEAKLTGHFHGTTNKNLTQIDSADAGDSKAFKIALLSDPHYHFNELHEALMHINKKDDIAFVIVAGDLTENGLMQEFIYFHQIMSELNIPYLTVIGNHDYLSNGDKIYGQMFGANNYTFEFNNVKFVLFDNVCWESNKEPDLTWFAGELENDHKYDHVIPLSHIPPYDSQMADHAEAFHELLLKNGIQKSMHGHKHDFSMMDLYGDGVQYLSISSPQKGSYAELTITPTAIDIQKIEY